MQAVLWDHDETQQQWEEIRKVTQNFTPSEEDRDDLKMIYKGFKKLEMILYRHLELEVEGLYKDVARKGWLCGNFSCGMDCKTAG